jgi:hypothetical protein
LVGADPEPHDHGHNGGGGGFWRLVGEIVSVASAVVSLALTGRLGLLQLSLVFGFGVFVAKLVLSRRQHPPPPPPPSPWARIRSIASQALHDGVALGGLVAMIVSILSLLAITWTQRPRIELSFSPPSPTAAEEVRIHVCAKGGNQNPPPHLRVQVNDAKDGLESGTWKPIAQLPVACALGEEAIRWATLEYEDGPHLVRVQAAQPNQAWEKGLVQKETYELSPRRPPPPKPTSPSGTIRSATGKVAFGWEPALRAVKYQVQVYRGADRTHPILDQTFPSSTRSFSHEFRADERELYWRVTAIAVNDVGSNESPLVRFAADRRGALQEGLLDASEVPPGWSPAPVPDRSSFEDANYCEMPPNLAGLEVEVRVAFQSLPPVALPLAGEHIAHGVAVFKPGGAKVFMDGIADAQSRCRRTDRIVRGMRLVGIVDRRAPPRVVLDQVDQALAVTEQVKSAEMGITVNGEVIYARKGDLVFILAVIASGTDGLVPLANRDLADDEAAIAAEKLQRIP